MPNWCEGELKVRGTKENLVRFINEIILSTDYLEYEHESGNKLTDYGGELHLEIDETVHMKGTHRGFVKPTKYGYGARIEDNGVGILIVSYKRAWGLDPKEFIDFSKEYNLDFKIYAFEQGMGFNIDLEVVNRKIKTAKEITFDYYDWECINPRLGG